MSRWPIRLLYVQGRRLFAVLGGGTFQVCDARGVVSCLVLGAKEGQPSPAWQISYNLVVRFHRAPPLPFANQRRPCTFECRFGHFGRNVVANAYRILLYAARYHITRMRPQRNRSSWMWVADPPLAWLPVGFSIKPRATDPSVALCVSGLRGPFAPPAIFVIWSVLGVCSALCSSFLVCVATPRPSTAKRQHQSLRPTLRPSIL